MIEFLRIELLRGQQGHVNLAWCCRLGSWSFFFLLNCTRTPTDSHTHTHTHPYAQTCTCSQAHSGVVVCLVPGVCLGVWMGRCVGVFVCVCVQTGSRTLLFSASHNFVYRKLTERVIIVIFLNPKHLKKKKPYLFNFGCVAHMNLLWSVRFLSLFRLKSVLLHNSARMRVAMSANSRYFLLWLLS